MNVNITGLASWRACKIRAYAMLQSIRSCRPIFGLIVAWLAVSFSGCSALTNPVANGIPAHLLPDELLAESKEGLVPIPLDWLRVEPPKEYRLAVGDIVGVYIEGALGDRDQLPPIHFPQAENLPPSIGFPIPISENGTISLPYVNTIDIAGLTVEEAQKAIRDAYTRNNQEILQPDQARVLLTLVRPRQARLLIIREDSPSMRPSLNDPTFRLFGSAPSLDAARSQGTGYILELPETEADVLSALAKSGGLPGPTALNEVIIYRGYDDVAGFDVPTAWKEEQLHPELNASRTTIRIPLRVEPGTPRPFKPEDVHLKSGDIVFVPSRDTDVYYTGGLMPPREVPLPRDNDIRVLEAILRVGGPVNNGGVLIGNFAGTSAFARGIGNPSPSLVTVLRKTPGGGQVPIRVNLNQAMRDPRENILIMPGDMLLLQETPSEAVTRYITNVFSLDFVGEILNRGSAASTATVVVP